MSPPDEGFRLDPRLEAETIALGDLPLSRVLLMDDARFPWLVLVPRVAGASEVFDLPAADYARLMHEVRAAAVALELLFTPDKINIAALGNVVAQLHVHVIARRVGDVAWPGAPFGHGRREPIDAAVLAETRARLAAALDLESQPRAD